MNKIEDARKGWTSASNASADSLCSGRHLAQKGLDSPDTSDSAHGNEIHAALAKQSPEGLSTDQEKTYELCNAIVDNASAMVFGPQSYDPRTVIREHRMWIKWGDGLQHSGQVDLAIILGSVGLIADYKSLPGEVAVSSKNLQLRDQAVLLDIATKGRLEKIAVLPVQPLVTMKPEMTIYDRKSLQRSQEELYFRVRASNDPKSPRTAGDVQCKFCLAKNSCKEYAAFAGTMAVDKTSPIYGVPVSSWSPQMRADFLKHAPVAEKWLEGCKAEMKRLLKENPEAIPGFTLKPGQTREKIINAPAVYAAFHSAGGNQEQFMSAVSVGKGALRDAVKTALGLKGKALDAMARSIIGDNVEVTRNEPSIVAKD